MVWRLDIFYINISIWVTTTRFSILVLWYFRYKCIDIGLRSHFRGNHHAKLRKQWENFRYRVLDYSIDIVYFWILPRYYKRWKMMIFDKVNYMYNEFEPTLHPILSLHNPLNWIWLEYLRLGPSLILAIKATSAILLLFHWIEMSEVELTLCIWG